MNNQEYFNEAVRYLNTMTERSLMFKGTIGQRCAYLTECGNKCVVGHFIPDGHPAQDAIMGARGLVSAHSDLKGIAWPNEERGLGLAESLQTIHDSQLNWNETGFCGTANLVQVANTYQLNPSVIAESFKERIGQ